jgi:hypothetical protein
MKTKIAQFIAWHLPERVVYFAAIRLFAFATVGKYSEQDINLLTMNEALQRWDAK